MFEYGKGICYQGYREGQSITKNIFPTREQVLEDLLILENEYKYIRLYDTSKHTLDVLEVIKNNRINIKVMLSMYLFVEENHEKHPFFDKIDDNVLKSNIRRNNELCKDVIKLAKTYKDIVFSISVGNEARSVWNVNRVSDLRISSLVSQIQTEVKQPVTYCEEWKYWISELPLTAASVDFISIHSYPVWNGFNIQEVINETDRHYQETKNKYQNKEIVITETGWPTKTDQKKIPKEWANAKNQRKFISKINEWAERKNILVFIFEAFDELWKGSKDPNDPEKNWGLFYDSRKKK